MARGEVISRQEKYVRRVTGHVMNRGSPKASCSAQLAAMYSPVARWVVCMLQRNNISHQRRLTKTISHYQHTTTSAVRHAQRYCADCNPQLVEERQQSSGCEILFRKKMFYHSTVVLNTL